ncbi:MAG: hypothetical protein AB7S26_03815 [Sandaracinaceae bacterium]
MSVIEMTLHQGRRTEYDELLATIKIGDFCEQFPVSTVYWTPEQYLGQWRQALEELAAGSPKGCMIASVEDPDVVGSKAFLWIFYRDESDVVFQNMLLFLDDWRPDLTETASGLSDWTPPREVVSEDGQRISEWRVPFSGLTTTVLLSDLA